VLLSPRRRTFFIRILSLIETALLIAAGFAFYFWVVPEPVPLRERTPPHPEPGEKEEQAEEAPRPSPPVATRDHYEFSGGEVFFDDAVEEGFVSLVNRAGTSLAIVTYTLDRSPAVEALERAASRGVTVRVIAGRNKLERRPLFSLTEFHPPKGILHEKFLVADNATVFLSSRNMTGGQSKNAGILFHRVPRMAHILKEEFSTLEQMQVAKRCESGCPVEYGTLYFLPGKGCRAAKEALLSARNGVDIAIYTVTPGTPLMTGLKKILKRHLTVRVVLDDWAGEEGKPVNRRAGLYLESLGAQVRYDRLFDSQGNALNFHHKFAVIDDGKTLLFGSMNWTKSACYRNRELLFITRDPDIAAIFKTYFDAIWESVDGHPPQN